MLNEFNVTHFMFLQLLERYDAFRDNVLYFKRMNDCVQ